MGSGAGLGGCHACIKYLMFAFNFIFWLIGCALVGFGIWLLVDKQFTNLPDEYDYLQYAGIATVVGGGIIMVVGFFGCCGAIRESQCLLVMFFICMLLLFIGLVGGGVVAIVRQADVVETAQSKFKEAVMKYDNSIEDQNSIDLVQSFFQCCGADGGRSDYGDEEKVPASCKDYTENCVTKIKSVVEQNSTIFAGVAIGAGVLMLLGMIFSMLLCCAIRDLE